ncbi:MAG: hypothetical protein NTY00_03555 [Deltaproteobacteria bacterium]|nr:hypothetical protein [Deltaproteobacteria bacterium]
MNGNFWSKVGISTVILGLFIFAFYTFNKSPDIATILLPPVQVSATAQELLDTVILARSEVAVQEEGHLAHAAFAIDNNSNHDIKNIEILCTLLDNAGIEQGRDKWVIYDTIKAHANGIFSSTSKKYVSNRASASQCQIVDMKRAQSPLIAIHRGSGADSGHGSSHQEAQDTMPDTHH